MVHCVYLRDAGYNFHIITNLIISFSEDCFLSLANSADHYAAFHLGTICKSTNLEGFQSSTFKQRRLLELCGSRHYYSHLELVVLCHYSLGLNVFTKGVVCSRASSFDIVTCIL